MDIVARRIGPQSFNLVFQIADERQPSHTTYNRVEALPTFPEALAMRHNALAPMITGLYFAEHARLSSERKSKNNAAPESDPRAFSPTASLTAVALKKLAAGPSSQAVSIWMPPSVTITVSKGARSE